MDRMAVFASRLCNSKQSFDKTSLRPKLLAPMPRSFIVLILLTLVGIGVGFALKHPSSKKPQNQPPAKTESAREDEGGMPLPQLPAALPLQADASETDQQINILKSQVEYLEEQVKLLQQENSDLMDKLVSIQGDGSSKPMPPAPASCSPPTKMQEEPEAPDFVGIGIELVKLRGLKDIPIPTIPTPPAEVEKRIRKWLDTQFAPEQGKLQGRALAALGAIPQPVDTIALKAAFLTYQVGGWYDETEQTLYLAKGADGIAPDKENAMALSFGYLFKAHHKQLFPAGPKRHTLDARLSAESVLSGDATLTRFLHALQNPHTGGGGGVGEDPDDPSRSVPIPNFLRELELLPFSMGFDFMQTMHSIGEWEQVNAVYTRPPIATPEIMDSQVYLQETPYTLLPLSPEKLEISGKKPLWEDTLGPLGVILFLKQHVPEPIAADTAPGWSNDRLLTFDAGTDQREHVIWQTLWKTSDAADAFFSSMRNFMVSKYKDSAIKPEDSKDNVFRFNPEGHAIRMIRTHNGQGILYIDASAPEFAEEAQKTLENR